MKGETVLKFEERLRPGDNTLLIHLPRMAAGIYLVSISNPGSETYTRKLEVR
jgi:hypothetical protein